MSLFVWHLLRDRVPTKDNLFKRRIISADDQMCVSGCGQLETVGHLFLDCSFFGALWIDVYRWLGIVTVCPPDLSNHLQQFDHIVGISKSHRVWLVMIWCVCIWIIWKDINNRIFTDKPASTLQLIDSVKLLSFWWLKTKILNLSFDYHRWWLSPLLCMGIG